MRDLNLLNQYRDTSPEVMAFWGFAGDHGCGAFWIPSPTDRALLRVIASDGGDWDHISVSRQNQRCPNWPEMDHVKRLFFQDDETVMQLHVPPTENISHHNYCLHLWRPHDIEIPRPPAWMVGPEKKSA